MDSIFEETQMGYLGSGNVENKGIDFSDSLEDITKAPSYKRSLPRRASKSSCLNKVANKSIKKTEKRMKDKLNLKPAQIKQLYLNQNLTNFKPTNLETIYEDIDEEDESSEADDSIEENNSPKREADKTRIFGIKKLKRTITFRDGFTVNKTLVKKRRSRIRSFLGKKRPFKKIPLSEFFEHLQKYSENSDLVDEIVNNEAPIKSTELAIETAFIEENIEVDPFDRNIEVDPIDRNVAVDPVFTNIEVDSLDRDFEANSIVRNILTIESKESKYSDHSALINETVKGEAPVKSSKLDIEIKPIHRNIEVDPMDGNIDTIPMDGNIETYPISENFEAKPIVQNILTDLIDENNEHSELIKETVDGEAPIKYSKFAVETDFIEENIEVDRMDGNIETDPMDSNTETDLISKNLEANLIVQNILTDLTDENIESKKSKYFEHPELINATVNGEVPIKSTELAIKTDLIVENIEVDPINGNIETDPIASNFQTNPFVQNILSDLIDENVDSKKSKLPAESADDITNNEIISPQVVIDPQNIISMSIETNPLRLISASPLIQSS